MRGYAATMCTLLALGAARAQSGWQQQAVVGPSARGWNAMAFDVGRGVAVMFGGWNLAPLNDTWEWSGAWSQRATATVPAARCCQAMGYSPVRSRVLMFGGTDGTSSDLNDTWEYDGVNWLPFTPAAQPSVRRQARMAFDAVRGTMVLFGGGQGSQGSPTFGDTWEWDGVTWRQVATPLAPPPRWAHGMVSDAGNQRIVLYGGGLTPPYLGDTWVWGGAAWRPLPSPISPPPSANCVLSYDAGRDVVVLFGGEPIGDQTWLLIGNSWVRDQRFGPSVRHASAMTYDAWRQRTVQFGGFTPSSTMLADTWLYDPGAVARWSDLGATCPGAANAPVLQPVAGSRPVLGGAFVLGLGNMPSFQTGAIAIGFSDTAWNGIPLPLDLTNYGMPGCSMSISPDQLVVVTSGIAGAVLPIQVPNVSSLQGAQFFTQGLSFLPGVNGFGGLVSNVGRGQVGGF